MTLRGNIINLWTSLHTNNKIRGLIWSGNMDVNQKRWRETIHLGKEITQENLWGCK
jgi:hypothetical protein